MREVFATVAERRGPAAAAALGPLLGGSLTSRPGSPTTRCGSWVASRSCSYLDEVRLARLPMRFASNKAAAELGYSWRPAAEALERAAVWFADRPEG